MKSLTSIFQKNYYRTSQYIPSTTANYYKEKLDGLVNLYKQGGFTIKEIHCDNKFQKVKDECTANQGDNIKVNYTAAQEDVPRVE